MDNAALAQALFDALNVDDFERFAALFAADAVVWHGFDQTERPIAATIAGLKAARTSGATLRYEDRRHVAIPGGAIVQHVLRARTPQGKVFELHAMLRIHVEGGHVQRIEEYFDSAQAARMGAALAAS